MGFMWSRPRGLSLEHAWVTPATIVLGLVLAGAGLAAGVAALVHGSAAGWPWMAIGLILLWLAAGSGVVAVYGIRQRLLPGKSE